MSLLVAGNAAIFDLLLRVDRMPSSSEVASLMESPSSQGKWLPGGAAMTIALAARAQGLAVKLWHPYPTDAKSQSALGRLEAAGIDCASVPQSNERAARCVMIYHGSQRSAWSTTHADVMPADLESLFDGVTHLVVASVWSKWTDTLLGEAKSRDIPCSLIGEGATESLRYVWHTAIVDEQQREALNGPSATTLVITRGAKGAVIVEGGADFTVPATTAKVVDTTGAGDTFGGTFLARRLLGDTVPDAAKTAADVAARACEGWGAWAAFNYTQPARPSASFDERIRGALIGTACGDAFGMPNSFLRAPPWRTEMEPGPAISPYHAGYPAGRITDDTEQALALTDALEDGFTPSSVARRLNEWFVGVGGEHSLAVGPSTKRALMAYQSGGAIEENGKFGVTNGAAMRISPIGVYGAVAELSPPELLDMVTTACLPTHLTSPAISGAAALAAAISAAVKGAPWSVVVEEALGGARAGAQRGNWVYAADIAERIQNARALLNDARSKTDVARIISNIVGAGEPTTESVPAAIAIADYAHGEPNLAIEISGNLRGDTDTIAAMAGAICGAFSGENAISPKWRTLVQQVNQLDVNEWAQRLQRAAFAAHPTSARA